MSIYGNLYIFSILSIRWNRWATESDGLGIDISRPATPPRMRANTIFSHIHSEKRINRSGYNNGRVFSVDIVRIPEPKKKN